jgi:hypothetical protein
MSRNRLRLRDSVREMAGTLVVVEGSQDIQRWTEDLCKVCFS